MSKKKHAAAQAVPGKGQHVVAQDVPNQGVHWALYALLGFMLLLAVGYLSAISPAEAWANIRRSFDWLHVGKPF